jgi:hypothetical protein
MRDRLPWFAWASLASVSSIVVGMSWDLVASAAATSIPWVGSRGFTCAQGISDRLTRRPAGPRVQMLSVGTRWQAASVGRGSG